MESAALAGSIHGAGSDSNASSGSAGPDDLLTFSGKEGYPEDPRQKSIINGTTRGALTFLKRRYGKIMGGDAGTESVQATPNEEGRAQGTR